MPQEVLIRIFFDRAVRQSRDQGLTSETRRQRRPWMYDLGTTPRPQPMGRYGQHTTGSNGTAGHQGPPPTTHNMLTATVCSKRSRRPGVNGWWKRLSDNGKFCFHGKLWLESTTGASRSGWLVLGNSYKGRGRTQAEAVQRNNDRLKSLEDDLKVARATNGSTDYNTGLAFGVGFRHRPVVKGEE